MSASVTQLLSSWTSAAGLEGGFSFCGRRVTTRREGSAFLSGPLRGLDGAWRTDRLRAGLDMATDILRYEPLAVHSAQTHCADAR